MEGLNGMKNFSVCVKKMSFIVIFIFLILSSGYSTVFAAEPQLCVSPQKVEISEAGKEITVEINVENIINLYGVDVRISFDPSVVEVKDALENSPGTQIEQGEVFLNQNFFSLNTVDNDNGNIQFVQVGITGFTGNGTVAKITFVAKKKGSTVLDFTQVFLSDEEGQAIIAPVKGGTLVVGGADQPDLPSDGTSNEVPEPSPGQEQDDKLGTGNEVPEPSPEQEQGDKLETGNKGNTGNNTSSNQGINTGGKTGSNTRSKTENGTGSNNASNPGTGTENNTEIIKAGTNLNDMKDHWAENSVEKLVTMGIVNGYEDSTFKPEAKVTRAEFVKMVVLASGVLDRPASVTVNFSDSSKIPMWAESFFRAAAGNGLIKGDNENRVLPGKQLTRAELAAIIVRAAGLEQEAQNYKLDLSFKDKGALPSWARGYIGVAVQQGIVSGFPDNTFRYDAVATRAQAAVMIDRLIEKLHSPQ